MANLEEVHQSDARELIKRSDFYKSLENLFDIFHRDALTMIKNVSFSLLRGRKGGGSMVEVRFDVVLSGKHESGREKLLAKKANRRC